MRQCRSVVLVASVAGALGCTSAAAAAAPPATAIGTGYDDLGRVSEVVDPAVGAAFYSWDAVGNLSSITRPSATAVAVSQVTPRTAQVGASVAVYGTGFSATASQDTVKFNGTTAAITLATPSELVVTVPTGATSGTITITAPGGSAVSSMSFTVRSAHDPSIASASTSLGDAGTGFSVSGTNFDTTKTNNALVVNLARTPLSR